MVELIRHLSPDAIRANLERVEADIAAARLRGEQQGTRGGRAHTAVLAATKYVADQDLPVLAAAGVRLVGENRAQDMERKIAAHGDLFDWDFIGRLQSRRVKLIAPHVRLIHSVASESALAALERALPEAKAGLRILLEVNVSEEQGKAGIEPGELAHYLSASPVPVAGLMTMPPLAADPAQSRPWFAALRRLADQQGLQELSMGTSQDYPVAVEEGATIVRIGTSLYDQSSNRPVDP